MLIWVLPAKRTKRGRITPKSTASQIQVLSPHDHFIQCSYTTTCIQFVKNEDSDSLVERQNVSKCLLLLYTNFIHLYTSFKILDLCIQFVRPTGKPSAAELPVNCEAVEFPGRKSRALRANAESQMISSKLVQIQQGHRFATKLETKCQGLACSLAVPGCFGISQTIQFEHI